MTPVDLLLTMGAATTAAAAVGRAVRFFWTLNRRVVRLLAAVRQLVPEDGPTIRHTVDATAEQVGGLVVRVEENTAKLCDVERRLNGHLNGGGS